jgi:uncharacterized protein (TIGR03437 family)
LLNKRRTDPTSTGLLVVPPGAILSISGVGMGPDEALNATVTADGYLPTSLGGTQIYFGDVPAPVISVQARTVVCIAPFELANRQISTVHVQRDGVKSNAVRVPVFANAIEILAGVDQNGTRLPSPENGIFPATPGSVVTLYVAGMGQTNPPSVDGRINGGELRTFAAPVNVVAINTRQNAEVLYAGPAPGEVAGISQVNFRIPESLSGFVSFAIGFDVVHDADIIGFSVAPR